MAQYIDKSALVAEIERRRDLHYKYYMKNAAGSIAECKYDEDRDILSFLDTIEVKEVYLQKDSLTWKDINLIDHLLFDIKEDYDNGKLDKEKYYKEVLKKFKAQL